MNDFIEEVLLLGINKIDSDFGLYAAVMPFINELLNLLTITFFKPVYGIEIYPHYPHTFSSMVLKTFIDTLAITGIVANASKYSIYGKDVGFVKGSLFAIFTFMIPNLFMGNILHSKSHVRNFVIGIIFIYMMDVLVRGLSYYYTNYIVKYKKPD